MADLKSAPRSFASSFLGGDVHIRFRPSFFPFTEPSVEVDMSWHDDRGNLRWIEMGVPAWSTRTCSRPLATIRKKSPALPSVSASTASARWHNVTDIREFYKNDVRFLQQFSGINEDARFLGLA